MQVFVKTLSGKTLAVSGEAVTVASVKAAILNADGMIYLEHSLFIFNRHSRFLSDDSFRWKDR